jgi:hypothetical protein
MYAYGTDGFKNTNQGGRYIVKKKSGKFIVDETLIKIVGSFEYIWL